MSMDIGPGDRLECIRGGETLVVGKVYTCAAVLPMAGPSTCDVCGAEADEGIDLVEHPAPVFGGVAWAAWCPCAFRKLGPPTSKAVDDLAAWAKGLDKAPVREREDA